ncbi:MAG: hypothetical protein QM820_01795 [Minicystis sp.]
MMRFSSNLIEEVEHPVADQEHGVDDLLRLLGHELEEALAGDEAELHRGLAEADLVGHRLGGAGDLLLRQGAVAVEDLPQALGLDAGVGGDDVALLEEDGAAGGAVLHDQLTLPAGLADERDDVADGARGRDLTGEAEDRAVVGIAPAVLADVAHHDEVRRRGHEAERALPGAHALAGRLAHGVRSAGRVHPHELEPLVVHQRGRYSRSGAA